MLFKKKFRMARQQALTAEATLAGIRAQFSRLGMPIPDATALLELATDLVDHALTTSAAEETVRPSAMMIPQGPLCLADPGQVEMKSTRSSAPVLQDNGETQADLSEFAARVAAKSADRVKRAEEQGIQYGSGKGGSGGGGRSGKLPVEDQRKILEQLTGRPQEAPPGSPFMKPPTM